MIGRINMAKKRKSKVKKSKRVAARKPKASKVRRPIKKVVSKSKPTKMRTPAVKKTAVAEPTKYKILLMGASYGSLLASKLLFGGHSIHLVCLPAEAQLINAEGLRIRMPVRGRH